MAKVLYWSNLVSMVCSLTGYSVLGILRLFFSRAMYNKALAIKPYLITAMAIFIVSIFLTWEPWNKIHYGDQPKQIIYVDNSKIKSIKLLPILPKQKQPVVKPVSGVHSGHKYSKKPHLTVTQDTAKQTSKYDLSHATVTQSAIGDHPTVNNYNAIKDRHISNDDLKVILKTLQNRKSGVKFYYYNSDSGSQKLGFEIENKLRSFGYTTFYYCGSTVQLPNHYNTIQLDTAIYGMAITYNLTPPLR